MSQPSETNRIGNLEECMKDIFTKLSLAIEYLVAKMDGRDRRRTNTKHRPT